MAGMEEIDGKEDAPFLPEHSSSAAPPLTNMEMAKIIGATAVGNSMEWFDFGLFAFFSDIIGQHFFPPEHQKMQDFGAFVMFGVAFLTRPLGGVLFGYLGDKKGRAATLQYSIFLMSFPTFLVGCLPTYENIGVAAPILLLLVRLLQGISVGGEWAGSNVYIYEKAPPGRTGFFLALNQATEFGMLSATACSFLLRSVLTKQAVFSWGWRLPFFSGLFVGMFGLWLRKNLPRSDVFVREQQRERLEANPVKAAWKTNRLMITLLVGIISQCFVSYYLLWVWIVDYVTHIRTHPISASAFLYNGIGLLFYKLFLVFWGGLGDRVNRSFLMQLSSAILILSAPIAFSVLHSADSAGMLLCQVLVAFVASMSDGNSAVWALAALPEITTRSTSFGISYNVAAALLGGTTPLIATAIVDEIPLPFNPGFYFAAVCLLAFCCLTCVIAMQEKVSVWKAIFHRPFASAQLQEVSYDSVDSAEDFGNVDAENQKFICKNE
jgi:MHS family proline/betaine transporter-like MFS transporter